jgi:hypothetical protein
LKGTIVKRSVIFVVLISLATAAYAKDAKARTEVKIIQRENNEGSYNYATYYGNQAAAANFKVTGATLTLQLPDGRTAVVNCVSKFQERFAGPIGNVRSCRVPLVNNIEAEFDGDNAKLFWSVSLDGKKIQSETYKILAVQ